MADWKQITARIRRARTGKDPAGQLTSLFSKTRDAMVAFELARYFETNGNTADAGRWYLTAAERFRRADWKSKAQESATRLGATEPAEIPAAPGSDRKPADSPAVREPAGAVAERAELVHSSEVKTAGAPGMARAEAHRQRRGRRGGRDRHPVKQEPRTTVSPAASALSATHAAHAQEERPAVSEQSVGVEGAPESPAAPSLRGRYGDPGLSSRLSQLEMNFRRLLGSAPTRLDEADNAPAGPGVWLLTDADLTTYYYVEPCQTLRVAIPNLLRGGAKKGESIRPRLAAHLGIPDAKAAKYLTEHCVVRWLQMDENAAHFAHFLIAVLRPALND